MIEVGGSVAEYVDAIPRTATGKWKKTALRDRFAGGVTA